MHTRTPICACPHTSIHKTPPHLNTHVILKLKPKGCQHALLMGSVCVTEYLCEKTKDLLEIFISSTL